MSNLVIMSFFIFGTVFGVLTWQRRYLFDEGHPDKYVDAIGGPRGTAVWVATSTFLWPVLIISGLHGLLRRAQTRRRQRIGR
ncbi:MAG: hypothetical protein ACOYLK_16835 [Sphingomonas sp.]